jgi:hypothetical protein
MLLGFLVVGKTSQLGGTSETQAPNPETLVFCPGRLLGS